MQGSPVFFVGSDVFLEGGLGGTGIKNAEGQLVDFGSLLERLQTVRGIVVFEGVSILFEPLECVELVECDARLKDVHERVAFVLDSFLKNLGCMVDVAGEGPRDEARVQGDGDRERIERFEEDAADLDGRDEAFPAGGRGLAFGQAVHHIVMHDVGNVRVPADRVDEVVATLAVHVAVTALGDDGQGRIGGFDGRGGGQGPAVQAVKDVRCEVMGNLGRLADARNEHEVRRLDPQLGQRPLEDFEDGKVAAPGAPGDVNIVHIENVRIHRVVLISNQYLV